MYKITNDTINKSKGLKLIKYWYKESISNPNIKNNRYSNCYNFLKMSTSLNLSVLKYDDLYKQCVLSPDNDDAIMTSDGIIIDYYFHKNRIDYDIIIKCFPTIAADDIQSIIMAKRKKFLASNSTFSGDFNTFIIYYNFCKYKECSRFPSMTVSDTISKIKNVDVDDYLDKLIYTISKKR